MTSVAVAVVVVSVACVARVVVVATVNADNNVDDESH